MTKIKICGITRPEEIQFLNQLMPDYIGFVFAKSRRQISMDQAESLRAALSPRIKTIGVFVNQDPDTIKALCLTCVLDMVQLHGDEDEAYLLSLKSAIPQPVIRAIRVGSRQDVVRAGSIPADYLLFDAYSKNSYGGTGQTFDWSLLAGYKKPFFLAGGLCADNLAAALAAAPYCADLSSGVEKDGQKDYQKVKNAIEIVRRVK